MASQNIVLWNGKSATRMGIGTWVMGGEQYWNGQPTGWADVDDALSLQTLQTAFDLGIRIIDTADQYGAGHAERIIAQAIQNSGIDRDDFVICTKVGMICDQTSGNIIGVTDNKADITKAIDASLKRLKVDHIDLVKFHLNQHPVEKSAGVFEAFSEAFQRGKIGGFGWSNDDPAGAMAFADTEGYVAVQHDLNLFSPADELLGEIERQSLWSFNRQPLAMGLLTGKYGTGAKPIGKNDIRGSGADWLRYFGSDGLPSQDMLDRIEKLRHLLTSDGRSLAQGALGWCLSQSDRTIPLPGCRTPQQASDNFGVLERAPLSKAVVDDINELLSANHL